MKNTAEDLAANIGYAAQRLESLLQDADNLLQSENMPKPYEQWDDAISAAQSAAADISLNEDITTTIDALERLARAYPYSRLPSGIYDMGRGRLALILEDASQEKEE